MKKTLVYYRGRAPQGVRTDWVMHEYRLDDKECEDAPGIQDSYALCRVFKKNAACMDMELEQGQCSINLIDHHSHQSFTAATATVATIVTEPESMSPDQMPEGSSSCVDVDDDKDDDAWMEFIMEDAWCSSRVIGGEIIDA
ncbi:unnamed protein product [Victoria cruziana]